MIFLKAYAHLEASYSGSSKDLDKITDWVENSDRFCDYIDKINLSPIPADEFDDCKASDEWMNSQDFHPDDLIYDACQALGWTGVPETLTLSINFFESENE